MQDTRAPYELALYMRLLHDSAKLPMPAHPRGR